jgi:hypothetical protein
MNPVYLVDPTLVKTVDDVFILESQFGISQTGRLLGFNPADYIKYLRENISIESCSELERAAFFEAMSTLKEYSARGRFSDNSGASWNVSSSNSLQKGLVDNIIHSDDYQSLKIVELYLKKRRDRSVLAKPSISGFSAELKNIFRYSKSLIIVDPYFFDTENRLDVLTRLIEIGADEGKLASIDIVVSKTWYFKKYNELTGDFAKEFLSKLSNKFTNIEFKYVIVNVDGHSRLLHARYILSNLGGLKFEHGLSVSSSGEEEIECLDFFMFQDKWKKYRNIGIDIPNSVIIHLNN